jgi:hypothetical protein
METIIMQFEEIAAAAGFTPEASGRLNLPATQETADALGRAALDLLPGWVPGNPPVDVVLTGAGPVWAYLVVAHALHGRAARLTYSAPNAPAIVVFTHGV